MADKKISALTVATTPLAGTEVLPIVQSSATVKVSVADVTKGRTIQTTGINDNNNNEVITITTTASAVNEITVANAATGANPVISATGSDTNIGITLTPKGTGNAVLTSGNFVPSTAAKGVNFTANTPAAGMTSQLLNWYEEGAYTATMSPTTSGSITLAGTHNTLKYTRIGRQVTVTGMLMVSSVGAPVGAININLPFAAASENSSNSAASLFVNGSNGPLSADFIGFVGAGTSTLQIYLGDGNFVQSDSADAMQANTQVTISATYFV